MTEVFPFRIRRLEGFDLVVEDGGLHAQADEGVIKRFLAGESSTQDQQRFADVGFAAPSNNSLRYKSMLARVAKRHEVSRNLSYLILVPTLRCNLSCTYCQVSRVDQQRQGYDMTEAMVASVIRLIEEAANDVVKVEFQGGEPTLRLDIIEEIAEQLDERGIKASFVICTNLHEVSDALARLLDRGDFALSTSFDGTSVAHTRLRTQSSEATTRFLQNLRLIQDTWGDAAVSALPTIDIRNPPRPSELLDGFLELGFNSIYLRPVAFHGYARKAHKEAAEDIVSWLKYYESFLDRIIEHNTTSSEFVEEYYFAHCLKRIFQPGLNGHVDIRNPSLLGYDYLVVDYDGTLYPTDEARMLTRIGEIDLSIGSLEFGVDDNRRQQLNGAAFNDFDPDCSRCAYQPYCGPDPIDKIARYGRVDYPTALTYHCQLHQFIFDRAFQMLYSGSVPERESLASWLGASSWTDRLAAKI